MSRIYRVAVNNEFAEVGKTPEMHLVDANSPAQAIQFVARKFITAEVAKPRDVADLMKAGVTVETTIAPAQDDLTGGGIQ